MKPSDAVAPVVDPQPVFKAEDGFVHATRYADVVAIARSEGHGRPFSTYWESIARALAKALKFPLPEELTADVVVEFPWFQTRTNPDGTPGRWRALHDILARHLNREAVEPWRPYAEDLAMRMLAAMVRRQSDQQRRVGEIDLGRFVDDLAFGVITEFLGFPATHENETFVKRCLDAVTAKTPPQIFVEPEAPEVDEYFARIMAEHRAAGKDGLLSDTALALEAGDITRREAIGLIFGCYVAGYETTATTAKLTLGLFDEVGIGDELLTRLGPDGVAWREQAEAEARRWPPYPFNLMVCEQAVTFRGYAFESGDLVMLHWDSAYRDPDEFAHPDQFWPDRPECLNVGFGYGIHRCLGEWLARLIVDVAVWAVYSSLPRWRTIIWNRDAAGMVQQVTGFVAAYDLQAAERFVDSAGAD